jgi:hypothetical protein
MDNVKECNNFTSPEMSNILMSFIVSMLFMEEYKFNIPVPIS